jgi:hypothetical protein
MATRDRCLSSENAPGESLPIAALSCDLVPIAKYHLPTRIDRRVRER